MAEEYRFSRRVPLDAVNLAWFDIPGLDVTENISLVESARFIAENINLAWREKLEASITGVDTITANASGFLYITTYNADTAATGQVSAGASTYVIPRERTQSVSPSGFVIENFTSEIRVYHPSPNETDVWNLRIKDGVIVRHYVVRSSDRSWLTRHFNVGDELVCFYSIPEILQIPYKNDSTSWEDARVLDVSGVVAEVADERTIQLPTTDLVEVYSLKLNDQELITSSSGILRIETDFLTEQAPERGPFSTWDPVEGLLTLNRAVDDRDEIIVCYRYREYLYTYEGYVDDSNVYHDLDLNPSPGHTFDSGRVTAELLNIPIYLYLLPTAAYRYRDSGGNVDQQRRIMTGDRFHNSFLRWEKTADPISVDDPVVSNVCLKRYVYGTSYFGSARFVDSVPVDTLTATSTGSTSLANLPSAIILAKLYVTSNAQIENVTVLDTRTRGGGITVATDPADVKLPGETRREAETYWDISGWDGQPVPLGGVLLVELPAGILSGTNNYPEFTQDEIEAIVRQHVAAGIRVVIRYV
jgi:hypothetical protein